MNQDKIEQLATERIDIIDVMAKAEVDRWDMDATIEYCVDGTIDYLNELDDISLARLWAYLFDEQDNPFKEAK